MPNEALDEISNLTILADIVINTVYIKNYPVRKWITDKNKKITDIGIAVVEKINDQSILANIATKAKQQVFAKEAVELLTDQNLLTNVARKSKDMLIANKAIEKLTDQTVKQAILVDISKNNKLNEHDRHRAAEELTDRILARDVLYELFHNDSSVDQYIIRDTKDTELLNMIISGPSKLHTVTNEEHKYDPRTGEYMGSDIVSIEQIDLRETARKKLAELQGK